MSARRLNSDEQKSKSAIHESNSKKLETRRKIEEIDEEKRLRQESPYLR